MEKGNFPIPPSHKTFQFGTTTIDSNFDSGNLYNVEKVNNTTFNLWIAVDHVKNQYRTWFHFSVKGFNKGTLLTFNIKNMQNQSKLLNEGLVPVFREEESEDWKRIAHKVDLGRIEYNQGWIEWTFKHTMTSNQKVFLAFFYPWSNTDNDRFLKNIQQKCQGQDDIYFKRSNIINSLQGRQVDFLTITSKKYITNKNQKFQNEHLFPNKDQPREFSSQKKCIIIGARVHPGEVPSSHVMTGIIASLTENTEKARLLRDKFVFYLFPIFNPDGVARGHYRVDPNGINLNRCYINPSPKNHSPIYAVKKIIMHFHNKGKYFALLDLHAHAARKGVFIYGNSTNQLEKQVEICLFPKILSMNSEIFQYEGSNFTEKNMYCKDINDHVSKEGAGRVAIFKATKNPYSWTLECNYNLSRVINAIEEPRSKEQTFERPSQKTLDTDLIVNYKNPTFREPKEFYTIEGFRKLGNQICQSFLDLVQLNPESRIDNSKNYFKSVQNLKMNLAVALLRMAPNRFQLPYKKIYHSIEGPSANKETTTRGVRALYYLLIKKAKIQNLSIFLKEGDENQVILPVNKPPPKKLSLSPAREGISPNRNSRHAQSSSNNPIAIRIKPKSQMRNNPTLKSSNSFKIKEDEQYTSPLIKPIKIEEDYKRLDSEQSELQEPMTCPQIVPNFSYPSSEPEIEKQEILKINNVLNSQMIQINFSSQYQRILGRQNQGIDNLRAYRKSYNSQAKKNTSNPVLQNKKLPKNQMKELPSLVTSKVKAMVSISALDNEIKLIKKGKSAKEGSIFVMPYDG